MSNLYEATIPSYLQGLAALAGLLEKAEAHCSEQGIAPEEMIQSRLIEDMLPFTYQVKSCAFHSLGAIEGVRVGNFSPDMSPPPGDFATLKEKIAGASAALEAISPNEINGFVGKDMQFSMGNFRIPFTAENFFYSFSLPNFYFHLTTAYDILRGRGVKIGKVDYLGQPRAKG